MSKNTSNINSAHQQQPQNNGKWALNVQDIIKRTHQNLQQSKVEVQNDNLIQNTDSEGGMKSAHQYSQSSQGIKESGQRMNTIQQKNTQDKNMSRARSKDKMSTNNLNTISHPQPRKSSLPPTKVPKGSQKHNSMAATAMMQNQILQPKQQLNVKMMNSRDGSKQRTGATSNGIVVLHSEAPQLGNNVSSQGQGQATSSQQVGRQQMNSMLGQPNQKIGARGTTPLRLNKQNTQKEGNSSQSGVGLNPSGSSQGMNNKSSSGQLNQKKSQNQGGNQSNKMKSSNNQQIKGIMAAALASVKENQISGAILPAGIGRSGHQNGQLEPQILNQAQSNGSQQDIESNNDYDQNYINFVDPNELMILKANSINQKYMTEQIKKQKIRVEDMIDPITGQVVQNTAGDADYIDTEDDEAQIIHESNNLNIQKLKSSPLRRPKQGRKSEERKVFSQQDFQEDYKYGYEKENLPKYQKHSAGPRQRGRSSNHTNIRLQTTGTQQAFSMERNQIPNSHQISVSNNAQAESNIAYNIKSSETIEMPKKNMISPTQNQMQFEFDPNHQILQTQSHLFQYQSANNDSQQAINQKVEQLTDQSAKFEVSQSQLTQRLDIFEEEIIKRVREIQKYSKGLNSLIRKNVMADLALTVDKVAKIEQGQPKQTPKIDTNVINQDDEMRQLEEKINGTQMQIAQQDTTLQNMQINIETDINTRFNLLELKIEEISTSPQRGGDNPEIQQKLVEQNQLITMLDEHVSEQEQQIQQIQSQLNERETQLNDFKSQVNYQLQPPAQSTKITSQGDQNQIMEFVNALNSNISQTIDTVQEKLNQLDQLTQKQQEDLQKQQDDSESRDGLMLKLNEDITNLFSTSEQVLENQKSIKEGFESMDLKIQQMEQNIQDYSQDSVSREMVETLIIQTQEQLQNQLQQMNIPSMDQSQEVNEQIGALEEAFEKKINDLRLIQDGRLKMCLEQSTGDMSQNFQKELIQLQEQMDQFQSETDNMLNSYSQKTSESIKNINQALSNLQEGNQSLELQFQAQIDEQNATQDSRLKKLEIQIYKEESSSKSKISENKIENSVCKTDFNDLLEQFGRINIHVEELSRNVNNLESKDLFTIIESKSINPIHKKIEDLALEIDMKNQELNEHQDSQINELITRIKSIQDNFEELQNIVVEVEKDVNGLKHTQNESDQDKKVNQEELKELTDAITCVKLDTENFKDSFEIKCRSIYKAQADENSKQLSLIQKNKEDFTVILQNQQQEIQTVQSSVTQQITQIKSSVVQEIETVKKEVPVEKEIDKSDIERVERQINEIQIQVKNIYKENTNEFNEIQIFKDAMTVFEQSSRDRIQQTNDHIKQVKEQLTEMFNVNFQTILKDIESLRTQKQPSRKSDVSDGVSLQQIEQIQKQIEDLTESTGAVQKSFEILATMMPQIHNMQQQIQSLNTEPSKKTDSDEELKSLQNEIKEQNSVVKRMENSLLSKIDLNSMDIKSLKGHTKQIQFLKSELKEIGFKIQSIESQYSDVQTMKHLVDIMQDSNFGAQIDELRSKISSYTSIRHSMPQMLTTQSQKNIEHEEFAMQGSSNKKKVEVFKGVNPTLSKKTTEPILSKNDGNELKQSNIPESKNGSIKIASNLKSKPDIDLSSIDSKIKNKLDEGPSESDGMKKEDLFSGTDQDLQNNLKHLFQDANDGTSRPSDIQFQEEQKSISKIQIENSEINDQAQNEPFERVKNNQANDQDQDNFQDDFDKEENESIKKDSKLGSNKDFRDIQRQNQVQPEEHEKLYCEEVKLPILDEKTVNQDNSNSFKNSSKKETQENIQRDSLPESEKSSKKTLMSIGSINLEEKQLENSLSEEQKNKIADEIIEAIDMEQLFKQNIDEIFDQIVACQQLQDVAIDDEEYSDAFDDDFQ